MIDLLLENSTLPIEHIPCPLIYPEAAIPDNTNPWRRALKPGTFSEDQKINLQ